MLYVAEGTWAPHGSNGLDGQRPTSRPIKHISYFFLRASRNKQESTIYLKMQYNNAQEKEMELLTNKLFICFQNLMCTHATVSKNINRELHLYFTIQNRGILYR